MKDEMKATLARVVRPVSALAFFVALSLSLPVIAADKTPPEPKGEPNYVRGAKDWSYACWVYPSSRAIHGRLRNKDKEVFGKRNGEVIKTTFGTLVWRGGYSQKKAPARSTGWLFLESFTGPPFIRDSYDPKTNTDRH